MLEPSSWDGSCGFTWVRRLDPAQIEHPGLARRTIARPDKQIKWISETLLYSQKAVLK